MAVTVIEALRRFLPAHLDRVAALNRDQRRAVWAITHCRTPVMGGHLYACGQCRRREFAYHSCNHRSCPQCGRSATAEWVRRELDKRVGAPYFMVTFTLPAELRGLFYGTGAKSAYDLFFKATSTALAGVLASPRWLAAQTNGFTGILHTWNQRLHFHPHIHYLVPGAGFDAAGRLTTVKSAQFLAPVPVLRHAFRRHFRKALQAVIAKGAEERGEAAPSGTNQFAKLDPAVWAKDWGVHIQPFGSGANAVKYLGAYVSRTAHR